MSNGMIFTIAILDTLEPGWITKRGRKCRFLHAWCAAVWDSGLKGCYLSMSRSYGVVLSTRNLSLVWGK